MPGNERIDGWKEICEDPENMVNDAVPRGTVLRRTVTGVHTVGTKLAGNDTVAV
jgi:hypothetical protein